MGSYKGLKQVRRIVEECMLNKMHPVYNIKVCIFLFSIAYFLVWISGVHNILFFFTLSDSYDEEGT
jgi:rRNA processing protein Krr1/Pno1